MVKVLFVCTGNIFRSLTAEYCMKAYLSEHGVKGIDVSSAGTGAYVQKIDPEVFSMLTGFGIDCSGHVQRQLTKELLNASDLVVAMATYHQEYILKNFGKKVPLFNEVAGLGKSSVFDVNDVIDDYLANRPAVEKHIRKIVNHIHESMPAFCKNMSSWAKK